MAIGAGQQAVPDHSEDAHLHQGTHRSLGFGVLGPALALVNPLDPPLGLTAAHASRVRPGTCFRGLPCSRPNLFSVAFTSGREAGSGWRRGFGGANHRQAAAGRGQHLTLGFHLMVSIADDVGRSCRLGPDPLRRGTTGWSPSNRPRRSAWCWAPIFRPRPRCRPRIRWRT